MSRYHYWVLLTLVLSALPSFFNLPVWVVFVAIIGGSLHFMSDRIRTGLYGKLISFTLLGASVFGIYYTFESWFSGEAVLAFFIVVVFLKWGESSTRRDYLLLIFAAVILAAVGALYWETLLSLFHMLIVVFALTVSLIAIHMDHSVARSGFLLKQAGLLFILGMPLMLFLFMTFPRIPGPIWDIGLAFGLPIKAMMERGDGEFGKATSLQAGGISRAKKEENQNVLVAEFEGAVPFKSQLYWRGPVFWDFDGDSWKLEEGWDNRGKLLSKKISSKKRLDYMLIKKDNPVRYTLRTMPNGGRWLYGLDIPSQPGPESFISSEGQLLSIRRIDDHEPKLQVAAYLDYNFGPDLSPKEKEKGLAWPEGTNPRLNALGIDLAEKNTNADDIAVEALTLIRAADFQYDDGHLLAPGSDLLDRYFFDEKNGGGEYLAGSFAMLMRAAGVPARLVSGYRGGTIIALTNFVIVKRTDAHAWVEIWSEGKGWHRIEPKDIVVTPEKAYGAKNKPEVEEEKNVIEIQKPEEIQPVAIQDQLSQKENPKPKVKPGWQMPGLSSLFGDMQKWVINYDPDRQVELFKGAGFEGGNWLDMLIGGVVGVVSILMFYLGVAWWRGREKVDQLTKTWRRFCAQLEKKFGLQKQAYECPRDFLLRVCDEKPELEDAVQDIAGRYISIRYGGEDSKETRGLFKRQVQRFISMT